MSDLYFNEKKIILREIKFSLTRKKLVVMTAIRKELSIFILQLPICYILKLILIGANADNAKMKRVK